MTGGGQNGASGERRLPPGPFPLRPWLTVILVGLVVTIVNATSDILEFRSAGIDRHWLEPVTWEATSLLIVAALAPLIGLAVRRWTPEAGNLIGPGLIHFGLTLPFAIVHILGVWVLREAAYWSVGARYGFFDDGVAITLLYEWRKDVLVYAAIAATYWWFQRQEEHDRARAAATADPRIEVRDGGAAVFLAPADITHVEAAGNYVEFHTAAKTHLVRGTLASWEGKLTPRGFVRAHRSRLVNRARVRALKPTASGDLEITMDDGATLAGSRRFRAGLERT